MNKFFLALAAMACMAAGTLFNIFESLHITPDDARKCLLQSITTGYLSRGDHPDLVKDAKALTAELRAEGVRQLIQLAKEYTATDAFQKEYKKWRNEKLNPDSKTKLGLPKLGKILGNKVDNELNKSDNEIKYPSDPMVMVKQRLVNFLEISSTVDFDAVVVDGQFTREEYIQKSGEWKMCYRAGKVVVMAAREEAQKWLDELNRR